MLFLLSVAAWPAERAAYDATQIWVASGYLYHKSLGVSPQSWRHVDYSRWTLGPSTCQRLLQLPPPPSTVTDIRFFSQVSVPLMSRAGPSIRVSDHEFTHNPHLSFILEATSPHISAFSGVLLYFVSASSPPSVCSPISSHVTSSLPSLTPRVLLSVWNLGARTLQHWFFHSFLELCSELIGQCRKRLTLFKAHLWASVWVSFLSKGTNPAPVAQMEERSCHLLFNFFFSFARSNGLLSVPRLLCSVICLRVNRTGKPAFCFSLMFEISLV